jgi:capsular polysaccharide transport system permease protein
LNAPSKPEEALDGVRLRVRPMFLRARHHAVLISLAVTVLLPGLLAFGYLYLVAADQYSSTVSFTVRSEEFQSPLELLGGSFGSVGGTTASDPEILYDFVLSQKLVQNIDRRLDLDAIYSRPVFDPVFAFRPGQPIEKLADHWESMVDVAFDRGSGLIRIETFAFSPEDARAIAEAIVEESDRLVNELSQIAREDATRSAEEDLRRALERLREVTVELAEFRRSNGVIDPTINLQQQMELLTGLNQELLALLVQRSALIGTTRPDDPRVASLDRTIAALRDQIGGEEGRLSSRTAEQGDDSMVSVFGQYESLRVEYEFANQAYVAAQTAYDSALAEARRRSRYLATHIPPTFAESAQYPRRMLIGLATLGALFMLWAIVVLTVTAARDR